jgi:hypothetical protein
MSDTPTPQPTSETQPSERRGITRIRVDGFKSLRNAEIEVRPLTILAGANSSGKSAIMQPLLLMKQTLDSPYDAGALLLEGENYAASNPQDVLTRLKGINRTDFQVDLVLDQETRISISYDASGSTAAFRIAFNRYDSANRAIDLRPLMSHEEIAGLLPDVFTAFRAAIIEFSNLDYQWSIQQSRCLLTVGLAAVDATGKQYTVDWGDASFIHIPTSSVRNELGNLIHVSGKAHEPRREYVALRVQPPKFDGRFEYHMASLLNAWQDAYDARLEAVSRQLHALGLIPLGKLVAETTTERRIRIKVPRIADNPDDFVSLADVGFGVSQVLPVLVALLAAQPDQLVYIEQPELHLHPRAQHTLAAFIAEAAARGARLVIETHSDILLRGIQTQVVKYELGQGGVSKEDVVLHWFTRSDDGLTQIRTAYMNADGAYGDWPVDFAITDFDADSTYLDAVDERRERELVTQTE